MCRSKYVGAELKLDALYMNAVGIGDWTQLEHALNTPSESCSTGPPSVALNVEPVKNQIKE